LEELPVRRAPMTTKAAIPEFSKQFVPSGRRSVFDKP
jgi:hypothetical protein